jgi:methionyl-tRNA formyltransferase
MTNSTENSLTETDCTNRLKFIIANSNPILSKKISSFEQRYPLCQVVTEPNDLSASLLEQYQPDYIFFPHWSYLLPKEIYQQYECVIFHATDLPYGRGGSPIQNLISRGFESTQISAIRAEKEVDSGPVYCKSPLSLLGTAEEIFLRAANMIFKMIDHILVNQPAPTPQTGTPTFFKRRTPQMSNLGEIASIEALYDHIRMLDADGYPHAFLENDNFRFEFQRATLKAGEIIMADVIISKKST